MMLVELLLFTCLMYVAHGSRCVSESLKCLKFHRSFNTHADLLETPSALNIECLLQARFFACLRSLPPACIPDGYEASLPEEFQKKEAALMQLCTEGSDLRETYLMQAGCINKHYYGFCTSERYLGIDLEDEPSPAKTCTLTWTARYCIASALQEDCGEDASALYKELTDAFEPDYCSNEDDDSSEYEHGEESRSLRADYADAELQKSEVEIRKGGPSRYLYLRDDVIEGSRLACSEDSSGLECRSVYFEEPVPEAELSGRSASLESEKIESSVQQELSAQDSNQGNVLAYSDLRRPAVSRSHDSKMSPLNTAPGNVFMRFGRDLQANVAPDVGRTFESTNSAPRTTQ